MEGNIAPKPSENYILRAELQLLTAVECLETKTLKVMKKMIPGLWPVIGGVLTLVVVAAITSSCEDKVEVTRKYTVMEPVYMSPQEVRSSFAILPADTLQEPGKIYLYDSWLLINEPGNGIHVIDNLDPANPQMMYFINIPGNYDMAVKDKLLYADSYVDLVVIDIGDPNNIREVARLNEVFMFTSGNVFWDREKGVIVDWHEKEIIEVGSDEVGGNFPSYFYYKNNFGAFDAQSFGGSRAELMSAAVGGQTGIGGSMARFTISGDYLYSIDQSNLYVFDIEDGTRPLRGLTLNIGWGIETIFPLREHLFVGSQTGMHIVSIGNPANPRYVSRFEHVRSCDPVVVQDTIAYVTLRGGTGCWNDFTNQLDLIDIRDIERPVLLKSFGMHNPHGLGVDDNLIFICEGENGLVVYDLTDPLSLIKREVFSMKGIHAFDVIPYRGVLMLIGLDGLYQFDYSNPADIRQLSMLQVYRREP